MIDMTRQPERGQISLEKECKWKYIRRTKDVQYILCTFNFHPVFRGRCLSHFLIVFSLYSLWILIASFFLGAQKLQFLADVIHKRSPVWMNFCDLFIFEIYFWVIDLGLILFFVCVHFLYFLTVRIDYFSQIPIKTRFELGVPISTLMFWSYTYYFSCVRITLNADIFTNSSPEYQSRIYLVKTSDIQLNCLTFKEKDAIWSLSVCYVLRRRVAMSFATLYQIMASPEYMTILGGSIYQFHILGLFIYVFMPISNIHQQILPTQMIYTKF